MRNFCRAKGNLRKVVGSFAATLKTTKGRMTMQHLILAAVGAMMLLYAVIIVGCLKNPEW